MAADAAAATAKGCWTCKVRRKRCDGPPPVCDACATLHIACHYQAAKPEWMDGGQRQDTMARSLTLQIKKNSHQRRAERSVTIAPGSSSSAPPERNGTWNVFAQAPTTYEMYSNPPFDTPNAVPGSGSGSLLAGSGGSTPGDIARQCPLATLDSRHMGHADSNLMLFYLESIFPFLYPFYRPSALQGGRAWILELMLKSPVARQTMLCQSSYYLSLAQGSIDSEVAFDTVLAQTRDAFEILRRSTSLIQAEGSAQHLHGAVRTFASIMQLQRFEIALSSFSNCQAHLDACVSLFRQLLDVGQASIDDLACPSSWFDNVMQQLGPSSGTLSGNMAQKASAEQEAFRFSSALLILDDVIASIALQVRPRLYDLHGSLLAKASKTTVDLRAAMGCENEVIIQLAEVANLDAWKQECKGTGSLDVVSLVQRAMPIKASLEGYVRQQVAALTNLSTDGDPLLRLFCAPSSASSMAASSTLVTRIWAHATMLYLSVVVSGWQPANIEVSANVLHVLDLLSQLSPTTLLRTVCWPLFVASYLAMPHQEAQFRSLFHHLQPKHVFGTLYRALDILEKLWKRRDVLRASENDLAASLRYLGDQILLV